MANRFLKTLASAFVVENENNDTVDAQSTQGGTGSRTIVSESTTDE